MKDQMASLVQWCDALAQTLLKGDLTNLPDRLGFHPSNSDRWRSVFDSRRLQTIFFSHFALFFSIHPAFIRAEEGVFVEQVGLVGQDLFPSGEAGLSLFRTELLAIWPGSITEQN